MNQLYNPRVVSLLLMFVYPVLAHAATISGYVYDDVNGIYVESARISITGTEKSTVSERGGRYRFTGVEPGTYTLSVQSIGKPLQTMVVEIQNSYDEVSANFNYRNDETVYELDAFVVEGSLIGVAKGLGIRRSSTELKEVVASDAFGQFADRNPGEALQRVAGVTVENDQGDGSFIIIRGGAPEFSSIEIDGISLATPEEDGRRVNLNIITVDQLERIELSKTWTPKQKGNVIGGTVNMLTRSALDRGEMYGSVEVAGSHREIYDDKKSWRASATFGDVIDSSNFKWLGDKAIGIQFSLNQSEDFSGSDTVTWAWNTDKDFPFQTYGDQVRPRGYALQTMEMEDYNITRERLGASLRLELRLNENHEFFGSFSHNKYDDTVVEHNFALRNTNSAQFYAGTSTLRQSVVDQLGLDSNDPFVRQRLNATGLAAALTYEEAIALGEIEYDPETKLFTKGGTWPMPLDRTFSHTLREDTIDTYQLGGKHKLGWDLSLDWKAYVSEAEQHSEQNWLRFYLGGSSGATTGTGGIPYAGGQYENPYMADPSGANQVLYQKSLFSVNEPSSNNVGGGVRQLNLIDSTDERNGYELNISKSFDVGELVFKTEAGGTVDKRDKSYLVNQNTFGLNGFSGLGEERWPTGSISLADEFFDGGEVEGFEENFGNNLRFGPSFHEANTLAFLKDPEEYDAYFAQNSNHVNNNITNRLQNNYTATEDVTGVYLQQTIEWGRWKLVFGGRYEKTENVFTNLNILTTSPDFTTSTGAPRFISPTLWRSLMALYGEIFLEESINERSYDHFLPAIHLSRQLNENMVLRASITKTIARPLFTDLIPREIPDISNGEYGNSVQLPAFDLRPMESINYDVSLDYFIEPIGLFSVAVFYKDLDGPWYNETRSDVGPNDETLAYAMKYDSRNINPNRIRDFNDNAYTFSRIRNAGSGMISGVEITFDRKLNFLPSFFNGLGINSNISWFDSEAKLLTDQRQGETVPLFKQPDMTANFSVYYEKYGIFARLSYNVRGGYLYSVSAGPDELEDIEAIGDPPGSLDAYVDKATRLDFTIRYNITPNIQMFFEAINLTNEPQVRYRGNESRPIFKQYTDQIFTLGIKWNI